MVLSFLKVSIGVNDYERFLMGCLIIRNINGYWYLINFYFCVYIYFDVRLCVSGRGKGIN